MNSRSASAGDPCAPPEPGTDREVGVAGQQWRDQRRKCREVGGEIFVEVDEHLRRRVAPHLFERASASLLGQMHRHHAGQVAREPVGDRARRIRARVVGDRDAPGDVDLPGEVLVEAADAGLERRLLVVHGHDDVESEREGGVRHAHTLGELPTPVLWRCCEGLKSFQRGRRGADQRESAASMSASRSPASSIPTDSLTTLSGTSSAVPRTEACVISDG